MDSERDLSRRELNRAILARQLLLERVPPNLPDALHRMGGLQAQYAPAMYVGLWSRVADLGRDAVTRGLEERSIVQATLLRETIHLVAAEDYWPWAIAIRQARRHWFLHQRGAPTAATMSGAARRLRARLAAGPLLQRDIEEVLGRDLARGVGLWVDLVRVPPHGTWEKRRADLYGLAEDWLGPADVTPAQAVEHLVRSHLSGFGPAPRRAIATWSGLKVGDLAAVLDRMSLRCYRGPDGEDLLDLPDGVIPDAAIPAPVRCLPVWDASLLVHARRTAILPEEHRRRVFSTRTPHGVATFLVDGAVAGAWRLVGGKVVLDPFQRLSQDDREALEAEAERLAAFHA